MDKKSTAIVIWLTGLSGSGKSTLANALNKKMTDNSLICKELDGDFLRNGINSDLQFSEEDRFENIRRAAEIAKLFIETDMIAICSFITPSQKMRALAKNIIGQTNFLQVYVNCSLEECEKRDVKGLYKKARLGTVANFTGISSNFEPPIDSDIEVNTELLDIETCTSIIYTKIIDKLEVQF